jgi:hypothetical protein
MITMAFGLENQVYWIHEDENGVESLATISGVKEAPDFYDIVANGTYVFRVPVNCLKKPTRAQLRKVEAE